MLKPQDIIVLIKLHTWNKGRWKIASIAEAVFLSTTETHQAIKRLEKSFLFDSTLERARVSEMEEFIIHGLRYSFPPEVGTMSRGVPTAHSAPPLSEQIASGPSDAYVWPYAKGKSRGLELKPLYRSAPQAALADDTMYRYLALIDGLRVGKAREQNIARDELKKLIQQGNSIV